jgi:3-hydroxyisobutyrate dehydrogenase-like beta-hydroxyacid dehydrogenase
MAPQVAWIGLGNMGRVSPPSLQFGPTDETQGMCKNLVEKGNLSADLIIYNRTTQRAKDLSAKIGHSSVASSVTEAASAANIIFYCLGDDKAVLSTLDEILKADLKGKLIVDCSTVHPDTTTQESERIEAAGASFVACPVFGAPAMADAGKLVCVLAGKPEAVEKVKPFTKGVMGRENIELPGQDPSKATLLKVLGNTFVFSMVEALSEAHVVAEKTGLGMQPVHDLVSNLFAAPYAAYSTRMMSGDYYKRDEPLFAVDLAIKDCNHAQSLANKAGVTMNNVKRATELLKDVKDHEGAKGDIAGIYGAKRAQSDLKFEN